MSEPIQPALTPEEWSFWSGGGDYREEALRGACDRIAYSLHQNIHALAALALHGQPFGFTWEDVDLLREMEMITRVAAVAVSGGEAVSSRYASLADRIAALLPPEGK